MKIPVLAVYYTLAETTSIDVKCLKKKIKNYVFFLKKSKICNFQNWKKVKINCVLRFSVPNLVGLAF